MATRVGKSRTRPRNTAVQRLDRSGVAQAGRREPAVAHSRMFLAALVLALVVCAIAGDVLYLRSVDSLDMAIFHCYAHGFWQGAGITHQGDPHFCAPLWDNTAPQRFRSLPQEYPASALAIFSLPLLTPWLSYTAGYLLWMALLLLLATGLLAWRTSLEAAIALPFYALLAGWGFTLERYDLIVGLLVLLALVLAQRDRFRAAAAVLAIATLLKLFPVVLLPLLLIACKRGTAGRWRLDLVALFAAVCLLGSLPVLLFEAASLWAPFHFELSRPLHIESLPGSLLWLTSNAGLGATPGFGGPEAIFSYNSLNVSGGAQSFWALLFALAGVAGVGAAYWRAWRGRDSLARGVVLVLLVVLMAGKVFSPQYLLWVFPAVALVEGVRLRWLLLAVMVSAIMACYYNLPLGTLPWSALFMSAIVARNLLLLGLVGLYLASPGDLRQHGWPTLSLREYLR